jgi:hypothetical protein
VPPLALALTDANDRVTWEADSSLAHFTDGNVALEAALSLAHFGDSRSRPLLQQLLADPRVDYRHDDITHAFAKLDKADHR